MINIYDWYWLADDGRVFSSARQVIVDQTDADYVTWSEFNAVSPWPRDAAGNQTNDTLQDVLSPYNIFVDLPYYTAHVRQATYSGGITVNGIPFATDANTLNALNAAYILSQTDTAATFAWKLPDASFVTLDAAGVAAVQASVAAFGEACFACEDVTLDQIEAGAITTREEVDAEFAAVQRDFTGLTEDTLKRRHGKYTMPGKTK